MRVVDDVRETYYLGLAPERRGHSSDRLLSLIDRADILITLFHRVLVALLIGLRTFYILFSPIRRGRI